MSIGSTIPLTSEPQAGDAARASGFLENSLPVYFVLGTFFAITLPFSVFAITEPDFFRRNSVLVAFYLCCFSITHFALTLTIYLQSANLRYFSSTWVNRTIYFVIPISIFVLFDLYSALQVAALFPVFASVFRSGIRFLDFHHFNRQNFGVLQLFKARSQAPFPKWLKTAENLYFFSLSLWLMQTFFNEGKFNGNGIHLAVTIPIVALLLTVILYGFAKAWIHSTNRAALLVPLGYFLLQSVSAALAIYATALYFFALAMHYVEYHVLMVPRCFKTNLDSNSGVDRFFERLRGNKALFYTVLFALSAWITAVAVGSISLQQTFADRSGTLGYVLLLGLFDGIFVFHYFVESFIWKFSDSYYRQTLGPLYFGDGRPKPIGVSISDPTTTGLASAGTA